MDARIKWVVILCLAIALISSNQFKKEKRHDPQNKSITFIMGNDKAGKSYFSYASEYYLKHPLDKTDIVTNACHTIECVIEYLNSSNFIFDQVNLMAHGNSKTGLNLYLSQDGFKATPKRMVQEVLLGNLPSIRQGVLSEGANIDVWSCGIGTNPMISLSLEHILNPEGNDSVNVYCSPYFVVFKPDDLGRIRKVNANYWPYYFKRGYRPSMSEIEADMRRAYPTIKHDWGSKVNTYGDPLQTIDYHLPISFTKVYADKNGRPNISTDDQQREWVLNQSEIVDQLKALELNYSDFHWTVSKRKTKLETGAFQFSIKAIGMTTVMCFLEEERPIREEFIQRRNRN